MRTNLWLTFAAMISSSVLAQQAATNAPAPIETPAPAPAATNAATTNATNTPPKKAPTSAPKKSKKKAAAKTAPKKAATAELASVPLVAGPAVVVASNVNVRGQAKLKSEIVGRVNKGQPVTVLEEIILKNSGPDEPSAWAKILLPTNTYVWVNTSFINASNKTVAPKKLNVRGGPSENYSVLGTMKRGDAIKEISTKGEWTQVEPPADAFAFVAAQYLKQEPGGAPPVVETKPTEPPPVVAAVPEPPIAAPPPTTEPTPTPTPITTNAPEPTPEPVAPEPPPKRIVQREGVVRGTFSIQAPTHFELISPETGRVINYLYTTSVNLDLMRYKGMRIVVTGEEGLDERWHNTPVITIQKIQVVE
jgi:uncharacterized protein YgiM (DUF1202 family)